MRFLTELLAKFMPRAARQTAPIVVPAYKDPIARRAWFN